MARIVRPSKGPHAPLADRLSLDNVMKDVRQGVETHNAQQVVRALLRWKHRITADYPALRDNFTVVEIMAAIDALVMSGEVTEE